MQSGKREKEELGMAQLDQISSCCQQLMTHKWPLFVAQPHACSGTWGGLGKEKFEVNL